MYPYNIDVLFFMERKFIHSKAARKNFHVYVSVYREKCKPDLCFISQMLFEHNTNMSFGVRKASQTNPSISIIEVSIFLLEKEKRNSKKN